MDTLTSPTHPTIKVYKTDVRGWNNFSGSPRTDPASILKVCRVERYVERAREFTAWQSSSVEEPTSFDTRKGLGPTLSQLPGEIRIIIYSYLLATGHLEFLRASKALYVEGSSLVSNTGIYRMNFGTSYGINYFLPSQRIVDTIRSLDVRVNLSRFEGLSWSNKRTADLWLLQAFGEPGAVRGQCRVSLAVNSSTIDLSLQDFCMPLRLLSDFETVVVRTEIEQWHEPGPSTLYFRHSLLSTAGPAWLEQRETGSPVTWSVFKCQFIRDLLLPLTWNLGSALREEEDESSLRLVFHPRKALEEVGSV